MGDEHRSLCCEFEGEMGRFRADTASSRTNYRALRNPLQRRNTVSDDETREDPDVEAHKRHLPATDEPEGEGDDVEAHKHLNL